ncbi:hypothetical protein [Desulfosporosinus shakirovi]|uniref:hypothetical protein n=1 Tax=Desulfosporosinus shakirovi TaxID=2885154 RepID=UPI001E5DF899|nr:hypothetical protein [Desulfosporosinus sp. SRJS8]MCB8817673.1 hypothetical protein [Desulfosporosinus sp. SRJS8]
MNKKGKSLTMTGGVLALAIASLVIVNTNAFSDEIVKKGSKQIEVETNMKDRAIKTFDINTKNEKVLYNSDVFNNKTATESADVISKYIPIYFIGENEVSIGIKHSDGNYISSQI